MPRLRPTTKEGRKAKEPAALPAKFVPRFWELDSDKRQTRIRIVRQAIEQLCEHCNADSMQKRMLVERAVFLDIQCRTIELDSYSDDGVDLKRIAVHTQMCNALGSILQKLRLDKATLADIIDLDAYLATKDKAKARSS